MTALVFGHRFSGLTVPENTLMACQHAADSGLQWVEFDVMLAACGTPVVCHDVNLRRLTGHSARMRRMRYEDLIGYQVFNTDRTQSDRIPRLQEVLTLCAQLNLGINVEIKPLRGQETKTAKIVWQTIQEFWPETALRPLYSSFSLQSLRVIRHNDAHAWMGLIIDRWRRGKIKQAQQLACQSMHCHQRIIKPARIEFLHEAGFDVFVYTINDPCDAKRLLTHGVDGVFTDDASLMVCR